MNHKKILALTLSGLMTIPYSTIPVFAEGGDLDTSVIAEDGQQKNADNVNVNVDFEEGEEEDLLPAVMADGTDAQGNPSSVDVSENVNSDVTAEGSYKLLKPGESDTLEKQGYSTVIATNGGNVSVGGNVATNVKLNEDEHTAENVPVSGVEALNNGTVEVGGDINVRTAVDPYNSTLPDTENFAEYDSYSNSFLGHYSIGANNEGGKVTVDGKTTVKDSHYAIGTDAGEKYVHQDLTEEFEEPYIASIVEQHEDGETADPLDRVADMIRQAAEAIRAGYETSEDKEELTDIDRTSDVILNNDVNATGGMYAKGAYVRSNGNVTINGNVSSGNLELTDEDKENLKNTMVNIINWRADSYDDLSPEDQAKVDKIVDEAKGVHNQGIVAQGFSGNLSDETRQQIADMIESLYDNGGEPLDWNEWEGWDDLQGIEYFLPWKTVLDYDIAQGNEDDGLFATMLVKNIMGVSDETLIHVTGNVFAYGAKVVKGISNYDGNVTVDGDVTAEKGDATVGVLSVGDDAKTTTGSVSAEGKNSAVGIASFAGETEVNGNVVVNSDAENTGVFLSSGQVVVNGDVEVGENGTGIKTFALDNREITILTSTDLMDFESFEYEPTWHCINRYSDDMKIGEILSHFLSDIEGEQTVVVDGTVVAKNGISVIDGPTTAKIIEDYVVNRAIYNNGLDLDEDTDPRTMSDDELEQKWEEAKETDYYLYQMYSFCRAVRQFGEERDKDPDITVWCVEGSEKTVNDGTEEFTWQEFLNNWTFLLPTDMGNLDVEDWDSTVKVDYNHNDTASRVQSNINYIIRIGKVYDEDGKESSDSEITLQNTRDSHGFATAREDEEVTILVKCADGYELDSVTGGKYVTTLVKNNDGTWTLTVPEKGAVEINAVLKAIEYTVKFVDENGNVLQEGTYKYGETPDFKGATPTKEGNKQYSYSFARWDQVISPVTGNIIYKAIFNQTLNQYPITLIMSGGNLDGNPNNTVILVNYGETIILPKPVKDGQEFDYWEGSKYYAGDKYTVEDAHTFTAVWKKAEEKKSNVPAEVKPAEKKAVSPNTADNNGMMVWFITMMSMLGIAGAVFYKRLRKN